MKSNIYTNGIKKTPYSITILTDDVEMTYHMTQDELKELVENSEVEFAAVKISDIEARGCLITALTGEQEIGWFRINDWPGILEKGDLDDLPAEIVTHAVAGDEFVLEVLTTGTTDQYENYKLDLTSIKFGMAHLMIDRGYDLEAFDHDWVAEDALQIALFGDIVFTASARDDQDAAQGVDFDA